MNKRQITYNDSESFNEDLVELVWQKLPNLYPFKTLKKDIQGKTISRTAYGSKNLYGWEIDHIKSIASGGTDDINNLQPLQWQNKKNKDESSILKSKRKKNL